MSIEAVGSELVAQQLLRRSGHEPHGTACQLRLAPGRLMLLTMPLRTGSRPVVKRSFGRDQDPPPATITTTPLATRSLASWQAINLTVSPTISDGDVPPVLVAGGPQALAERDCTRNPLPV
jgi:hypothetical protein